MVRAPTRRSLAAFGLCTTDPARCTYASPAPRPQTPCSLLDLCGRRDLYYSSAGGYEQALVASELPHWLGAFTSQPIVRGAPSRRRLRSRAVTRLCSWARTHSWGGCPSSRRWRSRAARARVTVIVEDSAGAGLDACRRLCRAGYRVHKRLGAGLVVAGGGLRVLVLSWKYISYGPIVSVWVPRSSCEHPGVCG